MLSIVFVLLIGAHHGLVGIQTFLNAVTFLLFGNFAIHETKMD